MTRAHGSSSRGELCAWHGCDKKKQARGQRLWRGVDFLAVVLMSPTHTHTLSLLVTTRVTRITTDMMSR
jgi:hypothetical protein